MMTRRELSAALGATFATLVAGGAKSLSAAALPAQHDHPPAGAAPSSPNQTLMTQPLEALPESDGEMIILNIPPGFAPSSMAHQHPGPVFAYILEGEIENTVDPDPPKTYKVGDTFFEPTMHVHRSLRNLSTTQPAKVLVFLIVPKGKPAAIPVK